MLEQYVMQYVEENHTLSAVSIVALFMLCIDPQLSVNIAFTLSLACIWHEYLRRSCSVLCKIAFHISGYGIIQKILRKPFRRMKHYVPNCCSAMPSNFLHVLWSFFFTCPLSSALITSLFSLLSLFELGQ